MSARLRFEPSGAEVPLHAGESIVDVADEHPESAIPFGCRSANCGMCRVRVHAAPGDFLPPEAEELELLALFDEGDRVRLACQLRADRPQGHIVLQVVEAD